MIKHLAIIGVGLIGGSLALALKKTGLVQQVTGYAPSVDTRDEALALGIIDHAAESIAEAVSDADMVFVAVPMGAMLPVFEAMAPYLKPQTIVTDGGSAKQQVVDAARQVLGDSFAFLYLAILSPVQKKVVHPRHLLSYINNIGSC